MNRRLIAGACCLLLVAVPASFAEASTAKRKGGCKSVRAKVRPARATCASLKRVSVRKPLAERLSALDPGAPGAIGGGEGSSGGGSGGGSTPALGRYVSVSADEFFFVLSRHVVGAGSVKVELRNIGEDPHNLVVSPDDGSHFPLVTWADTDPGAKLTQSLTLAAGDYRLWCSLEGHEEAGMSAALQVR